MIRGLHFQLNHPQSKIVSVISGAVWDVIVDLRPDSKTFKRWSGIELSAQNHRGIFIPPGFAHGFAALADNTVMLYQCDGKYDKTTDTGIRFDDLEISVNWPVETGESVHSVRDMKLMTLKEYLLNPMRM